MYKKLANPKWIGVALVLCAAFAFLFNALGKKIPFPGVQSDGTFVLANFERPDDVKSWKTIEAKMIPTTHQSAEGRWSAKVFFTGGKDVSAITLEDLLKTRAAVSDWSAYEFLEFQILNPEPTVDKITLLITDLWGKRYEEELSVGGPGWQSFSVPVERMTPLLNTKKINQISFTRRREKESRELFFDNIRLIPSHSAAVVKQATSGGIHPFDYGFARRRQAWAVSDSQTQSEIVRVPFIVKNETPVLCRLCPVEGGIPIPMDELRSIDHLRLRNGAGEEVPFQPRVLGRWPDGSVKWIGMHFESTLAPGDGAGYFLEYGPKVQPIGSNAGLKIEEDPESIRINTGVMEVSLSKKSFYLFERVLLGRTEVLSKAPFVLSFRGHEFRADLDSKTYRIQIEESGPQRAVVKASGWFQSKEGSRFCQLIARYYFYLEKSQVKVSHTLVYTGYPENKQFMEYKFLPLPANEPVDSFGMRIPFPFSSNGSDRVLLGRNGAEPLEVTAGNRLVLFQKDYDQALLDHDAVSVPSTDAFTGSLDISNEKTGLTVAVRNFRENFPKAFKIDRSHSELQMDLWPEEAGPMDLSTTAKAVGPDSYGRGSAFGLAKTHDLLFYFHRGNALQANSMDVAGSFMKPLILRSNPYWMDATGALGRLYPVDQKYATAESMLEKLFDWAARQPKQFKWYGMLNFGDTLTWWRTEDDELTYNGAGWHPVGRWGWYNCEGVGTHTGALLQFARSGEWKYFEFGENLARHIMDVDTVHYNTVENDKRIKRLISKRYSKVGAMHRHNGDHWGDRTDEASHTSVVGILLYYYLTGNERAFDVAKEVGEYFLTEPFTYIGHPHVAPNRAMSNALWGDVLLYQATGDERYKKAADKLIKIFLKGQQPDGSFLENYNPILKTWAGTKHELYMGGYLVGALISYHELTGDEAVKEMFLRLVRYLAPTEYTGPTILNGLAYAYLVTRDPFFIRSAEENLQKLLANQFSSENSLEDGLVYRKIIYHRPMAILSTTPYAFGALEENFQEGSRS